MNTVDVVQEEEMHPETTIENCGLPFHDTESSTNSPASSTFVEQAFKQYRGQVFSTARRLLDNAADAEDVTQDVFVKVVTNFHQFRGESSLSTWLRRITVNAALRHRQRRSGRREVQAPAALDALVAYQDSATSLTPDSQALSQEIRSVIEQAVNRLPAPYREVYVLADFEGRSNVEIGRQLGLTLPAVKTRLNRARMRIRENLMAYGDCHSC